MTFLSIIGIVFLIIILFGIIMTITGKDGQKEFLEKQKNNIIEEFKKSEEFSRILDQYADYKISEYKRTHSLKPEQVVTKETFINVGSEGTQIKEQTNHHDFSYEEVKFYDDLYPNYSQEEIAKFKENKIPSEWLRPLKNIANPNQFTGKKVVITGDFSFPRNLLSKLLWESGADLDTAIGQKTDFVIKGENAGWRKLEQIEEFGIQCISEDEIKTIYSEL